MRVRPLAGHCANLPGATPSYVARYESMQAAPLAAFDYERSKHKIHSIHQRCAQAPSASLKNGPTTRRLVETSEMNDESNESNESSNESIMTSGKQPQPHLVLFRRSDEAFFGRRRTRHEETHQNPISFVTHSLTVQHHGGPSALRRRVTMFSHQTRIHCHVWM